MVAMIELQWLFDRHIHVPGVGRSGPEQQSAEAATSNYGSKHEGEPR